MEKIDTNNFVDELCGIDPRYKNEVKAIEHQFNCSITCDIEKHNSLQYSYFYKVDFGLGENFFVEIESGINNGTQVNAEEWGVSSKETTKIVNVLKDIVLDMDYYEQGSFMAKKAQAVLDANKDKIFEFDRKNNYDNYVTGGNSKLKLDPLLSQLHLQYVYEEEEVYRNFL